MVGRRRSSLQLAFVGIACFVVLTSFVGSFSSSADHRTRTRRRLLISEDDTPTLTSNRTLESFLPSFLRSKPKPPSVGYSQPYIDGEPEYYCTHTWFHPCSAEDNATGPPLHMIQPGRLSDEDQDMIRVARKFKPQREAAGERMPVKKVAFMFLTKGPMPFAPLWERFFNVRTLLQSGLPVQLLLCTTPSRARKPRLNSWQEASPSMAAVPVQRSLVAPARDAMNGM